MKFEQIKYSRLANQFLNSIKLNSASDVVSYLGAVQSQDYQGAKWAIAQRAKNLTSVSLDDIFNKGQILRTHVLRPTWHFIAPSDIKWMLKLTAPRIKQIAQYYDLRQGVDRQILPKSYKVLRDSLKNGNFLTRKELTNAFAAKDLKLSSIHLAHILMHAELDAVIISGPLKGKQFSYGLFDERVKEPKDISLEESLKELAFRYIASHGPATVYDFAWWSGLTVKQAREGLEYSKGPLLCEKIIDKEYWFANTNISTKTINSVHLLPNYDEYVISFKDYTPILDDTVKFEKKFGNAGVANIVIKNGVIIGEWKRKIINNNVELKLNLLTRLTVTERKQLDIEIQRYSSFMGFHIVIT